MGLENVNTFILWVLQNSLFFIGAIISLVATAGFIYFLRGFLLGLNQLLYIDGHDEHVAHAREYITQGVVLMVQMFVLWVAIRGIATLIGFDTANQAMTMNILIGYACLVGMLTFMKVAFPKPKK